jgi:hypothetical protein
MVVRLLDREKSLLSPDDALLTGYRMESPAFIVSASCRPTTCPPRTRFQRAGVLPHAERLTET